MSDFEIGNVLKIGDKYFSIDTILRVPERITIVLTLGTQSAESDLTALSPPDRSVNRLISVGFWDDARLWIKNPKKIIGQLFSGKSENYIDLDDIPFFFQNAYVLPGENNVWKAQAQDMTSIGKDLELHFLYEVMAHSPWEGKSERPENFTEVT